MGYQRPDPPALSAGDAAELERRAREAQEDPGACWHPKVEGDRVTGFEYRPGTDDGYTLAQVTGFVQAAAAQDEDDE